MPPRLSYWTALVMLAAVLFVPVLAAVRPVADADIWWHLRVGQWITEHGQVTENDPFSIQGRPWIAYSWLFEVGVYRLYEWFGLAGVIVYRVLLGIAVVAGFQRLAMRCEKRFFIATIMSLVAAIVVFPLMNERPWLFTILFTTLTLEVVLDLRALKPEAQAKANEDLRLRFRLQCGQRRWTFWALPIAYVIWANVHIQFVYGFLILGIAFLAAVFEKHASWKPLLGLGITCFLATFINPYHVRIYEVVLEYATQPFPFRVVEELMAFTFRENWAWLMLGLALLTAFALGRRENVSSFDVMLFLIAAALCFRARRDLWMMVLAALVITPGMIPTVKSLETEYVPGRGLRLAALGLALSFAFLLGQARGLSQDRLEEAEAKLFPARAGEFLQKSDLPGPLFNHFNWGGYLMWKVPRLRVSIDGRTNLQGEERMERSLKTWGGFEGWDKDEDLRAARIVFAEKGTPLVSLLRLDTRFEKVYEDELAVIFVVPQ